MVAGNVSSLVKSYFPMIQPLHVFLIILELLFVLGKGSTVMAILMPHFRRIHTVENRKNKATLFLEAMHDVDKFIQTK
jgi:hypothetical protein